MPKAAIYARVSTLDQSCGIQLAELRRYAKARGIEVFAEYVDTGVSGAKSSRPARDKLMEAARLRHFDLVLVLRLDRWGRSVVDTVDTLRALTDAGVAFLAVAQNIGTEESNPMARFMVSIMSAFAELEREMIVERVVAGVRKAQAAGKHCGRPLRVFQRAKVYAMRAEGKSWEQISKTLGVPVGTLRNALPKPLPKKAAADA